MTDLVLIPLPGLGTLKLPRAVFEQHLERPAGFTPPSSPAVELLDADQLEQRTGIPSSWWMTQARERRIPFRKLGRYVRFDLAEVMASEAFKRRAVDCTGHEIQHGGAND